MAHAQLNMTEGHRCRCTSRHYSNDTAYVRNICLWNAAFPEISCLAVTWFI